MTFGWFYAATHAPWKLIGRWWSSHSLAIGPAPTAVASNSAKNALPLASSKP